MKQTKEGIENLKQAKNTFEIVLQTKVIYFKADNV